jgi:hypothetical protein
MNRYSQSDISESPSLKVVVANLMLYAFSLNRSGAMSRSREKHANQAIQ